MADSRLKIVLGWLTHDAETFAQTVWLVFEDSEGTTSLSFIV